MDIDKINQEIIDLNNDMEILWVDGKILIKETKDLFPS